MTNQMIIACAFCQGTGENPHFRGTCPACKGRGKNEVVGKYMTCSSCRGSGQKRGTTLTCYDCGGAGVLPDTRETFRKAREEIGEAQEEMARERPARRSLDEGGEELTEKPVIKREDKEDEWEEEKEGPARNAFSIADAGGEETGEKIHFCQCCGDEINESVTVKICLDCFSKVKEAR